MDDQIYVLGFTSSEIYLWLLSNDAFSTKGWINGKLAKSTAFLENVCIAIASDNTLFAVSIADEKLKLLEVEGMSTAPNDESRLKGHLDHLFYQVDNTVVGYDVAISDDKVTLTPLTTLGQENIKVRGGRTASL
jgi:hypothetical protein